MKTGRQRRIAQLIREQTVTNQNQLVKLLRMGGYASTQATVSRDLEELGAIKVRRNGRIAYALPTEIESAPIGDMLGRLLAESVSGLESTANLVVVKTPPGHAGMVAAAIDRGNIEGIAGTVAGDDTIFIACKQGVIARRVERQLRSLAGMIPQLRSVRRETR